MNYEFYIKRPLQLIGMEISMIIDDNIHLMNVLDGSVNHPCNKKYSNIPLK